MSNMVAAPSFPLIGWSSLKLFWNYRVAPGGGLSSGQETGASAAASLITSCYRYGYKGMPATISDSMPQWSSPRTILKKPEAQEGNTLDTRKTSINNR